ncbi:MAG: type VI secretion system ATPase TssH [Gemmatimonadetes bacterium]|nr:type VI secretion system ATPase TssH [Gemmatimonadota bacterium]NNF38042.1 type VI secretion system ATPase TssH [Gemmatimonadota bacterium]NNK62973.1 type VI secretion system ATPase TssH [Gemmatimonadota bacterium]
MNVDLRALIGKLNPTTRGAVEAAAGLCLSRTHYDVEAEHYLLKLLDHPEGDFLAILKRFEVDRSALAKQLTAALDRLRSGNARTPSLSPGLVRMLTDAWTLGSLDHGAGQVRSGYTILAMMLDADMRRQLTEAARALDRIHPEALRNEFASIVEGTTEDVMTSVGSGAGGGAQPGAGGGPGGPTPNLDQYTVNLTQRAKDGHLDPVLGRDMEIRQCVDILTRKRQNNPILVGEAGVGKTAVVEGFAMRIAQGDVPPPLRNVTIRTLDLALLQAGAGVKGEFENRLKGLIEEVKSSETPIILFIDEAHTMIGAGGAAGQNDAANLLKPALARGELRTLAATTWSEYKKYFEKDPALARRFQLIKVEEPTEDLCLVMMRGIVPHLERHHSVRILDRGVDAAVRLSNRYLPDRQLPDKAVSVLDTACARLSLGQNATPASVEDAERRLADLKVQARVLRREEATGADHSERLATIADETEKVSARLDALQARWETEKDLVGRIRSLREELERRVDGAGVRTASKPEGEGAAAEAAETADAAGEEASEGADTETPLSADESFQAAIADQPDEELRTELAALMEELEEVQGDDGLVPVFVDTELVGRVISGWTGIPVGKMMRDQITMALELEARLGERIIGQDHALEVISQRIRTSKAGIDDPQKPVGVFLLVGPSGVGKTETALSLSDLMFGGEENIITINMSEFQEAHTVSTLKGSPPGYVGYGEGGVLTEAVRRRPYSVVLLDEIEKAHPDVLELFFQVFDKGRMEDGEGREIDFKNCIIVLTSNAGTETLMKLTADPDTMPGPQGLVKALKPELDKTFQPAFLGRTVIIPFFPLRDEALRIIIDLKLNKVRRRLRDAHHVELMVEEAVMDAIAARCTEVESGARNIDNILTNTVMPDVSRLILNWLMEEDRPEAIHVTVGDGGHFEYAGVDAGG